MFAPSALRFPFEMLDGVGDVDFITGNAGLRERLVEYLACRSHERMAHAIFLVAGLFSDEQNLGVRGSFAEDSLGRALVKVAAGAGFGGCAQRRHRHGGRQKVCGGSGRRSSSHVSPYHG